MLHWRGVKVETRIDPARRCDRTRSCRRVKKVDDESVPPLNAAISVRLS
jgi:hypothetical protein